MIHTIAQSWRKLVAPVAFLAFFILIGVSQASAQSFQAQSSSNPEIRLAQKFGVTAYNMGTWTPNNVVQILVANSPDVKENPGASLTDRVTYAYYQMVITDVKNYDVAPEIALLSNLEKVQEQFKTSAVTENFSLLSSIYNSTIEMF